MRKSEVTVPYCIYKKFHSQDKGCPFFQFFTHLWKNNYQVENLIYKETDIQI